MVGPLCPAGESGLIRPGSSSKRRDGRFHPNPLQWGRRPSPHISREKACEACARGAVPIPAQYRSAERPSANGDTSAIRMRPDSVQRKKSNARGDSRKPRFAREYFFVNLRPALQFALNARIESLGIDHDAAMAAIADAFLVVEGLDPEFDIAAVD